MASAPSRPNGDPELFRGGLRAETPAPALGVLELGSIARGMVAADAMVKRATVTLLEACPLTPGKLVVIVRGGEEEVAESMAAGSESACGSVIDRLYLPKADAQLGPAIEGRVEPQQVSSLGIVESFSVASAILAADRAVKAAEASLLRLRLARGLGGKAFFLLSGELHQLEAAIDAARTVADEGLLMTTEIIARPHDDLIATLWR